MIITYLQNYNNYTKHSIGECVVSDIVNIALLYMLQTPFKNEFRRKCLFYI